MPASTTVDRSDVLHEKGSQDLRLVPSSSQSSNAEFALLRKIDRRFLPILALLHFMNAIDRSAIASARIQGLEADLHLSSSQYSAVLAILFASFCPAQIPANIILGRMNRPSLFIGACAVAWGLTSALSGVTHGFGGLLACRFFIGFPEAAFQPASTYLLSRWYTRKELGYRASLLYFAGFISSAIGNLLAAAIFESLDNTMGIRAWRWLFLIEGSITIVVGLNALWLLPDTPHNTRWLSVEESRLARVRQARDVGEADAHGRNELTLEGFKLAIQDPKVYLLASHGFFVAIGSGFSSFFPTLTATLGFSPTITLLIAAPPYVFTAVACVFNARHADKTGERFFHVILWSLLAVVGYVIALTASNTWVRYCSLFFMTIGLTGNPLFSVWVSNSIPRPPSKRAASIGIAGAMSSLGSLANSFIWDERWSPHYQPPFIICTLFLIISVGIASALRVQLIQANRRLASRFDEDMDAEAEQRVKEAAQLEGITFEEALAKKREFRYLY